MFFRKFLQKARLCLRFGNIWSLRFCRLNGRFHTLNMDTEVTQSADLFQLVAWLHANRKRLISILVVVVVLGAAIGLYVWNKKRTETEASEALSEVKPPVSNTSGTASQAPSPAAAEPYLKVAGQYPGTSGDAHALLLGAVTLFDAGKFADAQAQFEKYTREYPDSPLILQARVGVAASLEAQGKIADATARYKELTDRYPGAPIIFQAKSALARLYEAQNKPDLALRLYEELARGNNNDSWSSEAGIQREELLEKHPNLRPPPPTAPSTTSTAPMSLPLK